MLRFNFESNLKFEQKNSIIHIRPKTFISEIKKIQI